MTTETKQSQGQLSTNARNMIIGIITTVLVSGTVYLLGFNAKKDRTSKLERKKATVEAWQTYVTIENIYAKNTTLILRDSKQFETVRQMYAAIITESDQFLAGLDRLIASDVIDKDMVALLKRRKVNEETSRPRAEKYYMEMDKVLNTALEQDWSQTQLQDTLIARSKVFELQSKGVMDRALMEIETMAKTLSSRYNETFDTDEFFVIQVFKYKRDLFQLLAEDKTDSTTMNQVSKDYFEGDWDLNGVFLSFKNDNTWNSVFTGDSVRRNTGTWDLKNGQLIMTTIKEVEPKVSTWTYNLSALTDTAFYLHMTIEPYTYYRVLRK